MSYVSPSRELSKLKVVWEPPNLQLVLEVLGTAPSNLAVWLTPGNDLIKKKNSSIPLFLSSLVFLNTRTKRKKEASKTKNTCLLQVKIPVKCHLPPTRKAIINKEDKCW